jgi:hypothetical protein
MPANRSAPVMDRRARLEPPHSPSRPIAVQLSESKSNLPPTASTGARSEKGPCQVGSCKPWRSVQQNRIPPRASTQSTWQGDHRLWPRARSHICPPGASASGSCGHRSGRSSTRCGPWLWRIDPQRRSFDGGRRAYDVAAVAAAVRAVTGHPVRYVDIPPAIAHQAFTDAGPAWLVTHIDGAYGLIRVARSRSLQTAFGVPEAVRPQPRRLAKATPASSAHEHRALWRNSASPLAPR